MSAWERMATLHDTPPLRLSRGREPDAHATRAHHSSDATSIRGGQQHDIDAHECILCIMHRCRGKPEYGDCNLNDGVDHQEGEDWRGVPR